MKDFKRVPVPILERLDQYPLGSSCKSFHITDMNEGWRVFKPAIDKEKSVACYRCYLVCPDGAINQSEEGKFEIDYDYYKGSGICDNECNVQEIEMVKEAK